MSDTSDKLEQRTPAQHHESGAASRDRAYQILRQGGVGRDEARKAANEGVEKARRIKGV